MPSCSVTVCSQGSATGCGGWGGGGGGGGGGVFVFGSGGRSEPPKLSAWTGAAWNGPAATRAARSVSTKQRTARCIGRLSFQPGDRLVSFVAAGVAGTLVPD